LTFLTAATSSSNDANLNVNHCGTFVASETWSASANVHIVTCDIVVPLGMTLTIEAGAIVKFNVNTRVIIQGALNAQGTAVNQIVFTSIHDDEHGGDTDGDGSATPPAKYNWGWIEFADSSNDSASFVQHCLIRYGGADDHYGRFYQGAITLNNASPTVQSCTFQHNHINGIEIPGGTKQASATQNVETWHNTDVVYVLTGDLVIANGMKLLIKPGVTVKSKLNTHFNIQGALEARGTTTQLVTFTSFQDDDHGGDTDADGTDTPPQPNDWGWIEFADSSDDAASNIEYSHFLYGGGDDHYGRFYRGAITAYGAAPTIANSTFQYNGNYAIAMDIGAFPTIHHNTMVSNGSNGIGLYGGTIVADNAVWSTTDAVYVLDGDIVVATGKTLTIAPGATIKGRTNTRLIINGALNAQGVADQPITFTSVNDDSYGGDTDNDSAATPPTKNDWGWIEFADSSDDTSKLTNCSVRYGGRDDHYGAFYRGAVTLYNAEPTITGCTFQYNYINGIEIPGITKNATAVKNVERWHNKDVVYVVTGDVVIAEGMKLFIEPGVTVKFKFNTRIIVQGAFDARGTSTNVVTFTSFNDDTIGGDTDDDGSNTPPKANDWGWVEFANISDDSASFLEYCVMQYSGGDDHYGRFYRGAITLYSAAPRITYCTLLNNYRGIDARGGSTPSLGCNNIFQNENLGISNDTPTTSVMAENQWWGSVSGPTHAGNPGGTGQAVSNGVDFTPWSTYSCLGPIPTATPTPTITPTPIETPTPTHTPTATPTPTTTPATQPALSEIRPNQGSADVSNDINIYGTNFANGVQASLGSTALNTTYLNATQLQAVVPAGLAAGLHDLTVVNPDGGRATLPRAYTVIDPANNDDLFGLDYELWTDPAAPHANAAVQVGLLVRRLGGKQPLSNIVVRFYLGDPNAGGIVIGEGAIPLLSPRDTQNVAVAWTPPTAGEHTIYAVIDPANAIAETYEDNNTVQRMITVLAPASDQIAPHVDSFTINRGATSTADRLVKLDTTASDPAPSSGVAKLLFVEYEYSQAANQWVPVRASNWLDYAATRTNYDWQMLPATGMKYLQAWAADGAGNVALFPFKAYINHVPATYRVNQNQGQIYRYTLTAGQQLTARVESLSGDPDLYLWAPDHTTRPPWVSNLRTGVDDVSIVAPVAGVYQIEIYGFSAAEYRLLVNVTAEVGAAQIAGGQDPTKSVPSQPLLPISNEPGAQLGLPAPGQVQSKIYLPLIRR